MEKLIPGSAAVFEVDCPEEREYRNLRRDYDAILKALPKIDGWTITARPYDLNAIGQLHFDVMDLGDGEVGAKVAPRKPYTRLDVNSTSIGTGFHESAANSCAHGWRS